MLSESHPVDLSPAVRLGPPRAFGVGPADLDLSTTCNAADRPAVVTEILAACCTSPAGGMDADRRREAAWDLPIGTRIERLLHIVGLTESSDALSLGLRCPQPACGLSFEVTLSYAALSTHARGGADETRVIPFPAAHGRPLEFRVPTGRDQRTWLGTPYATPDAAVETVVRTLLVTPDAPIPPVLAEWIEPLARAMEEADPLVAFHVSTACPHCGRATEVAVDLEAAVLDRLEAHRRKLLREVHEFASRYGWTEAEVLSIPPARRAEYRRLGARDETITT